MAAAEARVGAVLALVAAACLALACGPGNGRTPDRAPAEPRAFPARIVSLVPATTEMIFAMGAGDRLVGVGSYDRFPPEVDRIQRVGGLLDPSTERIITLAPDLAIVYDTQLELKERLDRAGVPYFNYEHRALPDIMETVRAIGARLGVEESAAALAADMDRALDAVRASVAGRNRPTTLLVFGRDPGSLRNVNASGGYGFLSDLLDIAGATNVFGDIDRQSVQPSTETLLASRPDVIIELRYGSSRPVVDLAQELAPWRLLASVPAVRNNRVHLLTGDEFVVPGPRIVIAAERLARALHGAAP